MPRDTPQLSYQHRVAQNIMTNPRLQQRDEAWEAELDRVSANGESIFPLIGMREPPSITVEDARRLSEERSRQIFKDWSTLRDILSQHEGTIQRRWLKKTGNQRKKVVLTAWPDMSVGHRPDFEAYWKESQEQRVKRTQFREAFIWPYINVEDLCRGKILLLFLNARRYVSVVKILY
jgi:hypothetical protein